jgi:hypothetical protein
MPNITPLQQAILQNTAKRANELDMVRGAIDFLRGHDVLAIAGPVEVEDADKLAVAIRHWRKGEQFFVEENVRALGTGDSNALLLGRALPDAQWDALIDLLVPPPLPPDDPEA